MKRVPLAEAWRIATGKEPPPPMTEEQRRDWEAKLRAVRERAREIYGSLEPGEAA
jgi:hypothetical protein